MSNQAHKQIQESAPIHEGQIQSPTADTSQIQMSNQRREKKAA